MQLPSSKLFTPFKSLSDREFIFVEPGGNFGDQIIYRGAEKLAHLAGVTYRSVNHHEFMTGHLDPRAVIYIHGSGGFNQYWSQNPIAELIKAVNLHLGSVILGPSTLIDDVGFLKQRISSALNSNRPERVVLFAREQTSFGILRQFVPEWMQIEVDHDTALNLAPNDLVTAPFAQSYSLYAIRKDKERNLQITKKNFALWFDPIFWCRDLESWIKTHSRAREIFTNRAHSAILGAILGIPTHFMPNSYHKNRSIWEFSLKARGVQWLNCFEAGLFSRLLSRNQLTQAVVNSRPYEYLIRSAYGV